MGCGMMRPETTIYVCPNGCQAGLICDAKIDSVWNVDLFGNPVDIASYDSPDFLYEFPRCAKCGAKAQELSCKTISVYDESSIAIGLVYTPNEGSNAFYFQALHSDRVELIKVHAVQDEISATIQGRLYHMTSEDEGFFPKTELPGQESLF